jgi:hypothetical protein
VIKGSLRRQKNTRRGLVMDKSESAQLVINWLDKNQSQFIEMANQIERIG